ncbi:hypothetical protein ZEAMMB73_Zm00001d006261 [Zea mays]|jgi:shikimate O-hydroxycinnamoyltransferase|uniref:Uncharacterized protein n=1 Tax=Zea mays TaxID=4577 RepID=A0A1D6EU85_MAIZE|nr:hypothetical protein ZEAMMB73_Zm00001d006261 [Zea mays]
MTLHPFVVTYKMQMAIIYAFPPPAPSTAAIENGLAAVLAEYRAFAGELGEAPDGTPAVLLNDRGARLVEATADADLVDMAPAKPTPELLRLHPDIERELRSKRWCSCILLVSSIVAVA